MRVILVLAVLLSQLLGGCASMNIPSNRCELLAADSQEACRIVDDPAVKTLCLRYEGLMPTLHEGMLLVFRDVKSGEITSMRSHSAILASQKFMVGTGYVFLQAREQTILPPHFGWSNHQQIVKTCN